VELKNPVESVVSLDDERVLIRSEDCRLLGALGMPLPRLRWSAHYQGSFSSECTLIGRVVSSVCELQIAWRFGDASGHEPGLALRIQSHGFGYPFAAPALE